MTKICNFLPLRIEYSQRLVLVTYQLIFDDEQIRWTENCQHERNQGKDFLTIRGNCSAARRGLKYSQSPKLIRPIGSRHLDSQGLINRTIADQ